MLTQLQDKMNFEILLILVQARFGGVDANSKTPPSISRQKAKQFHLDFMEKQF